MVVFLLVGEVLGFVGVVVGFELFVVDVYCDDLVGGFVEVVVRVLDGMVCECVLVINFSFVGLFNWLLECVV